MESFRGDGKNFSDFFICSAKAFDGLLQLLKLDVSHNELRSIAPGAFFGLVSLRAMDLSHNQLKKLDNKTNGVLDDCLSLDKVRWIADNRQRMEEINNFSPPSFADKLEPQSIHFHHEENIPVESMDPVPFERSRLELQRTSDPVVRCCIWHGQSAANESIAQPNH